MTSKNVWKFLRREFLGEKIPRNPTGVDKEVAKNAGKRRKWNPRVVISVEATNWNFFFFSRKSVKRQRAARATLIHKNASKTDLKQEFYPKKVV